MRDGRKDCLSTEILQTLANGVLPEDQHARVREHLPVCSQCLGRLATAVSNRTPVTPTRRSEAAHSRQNPWPPRAIRWGSVGIAGLTLAVCVMWGFDILGAGQHIQHTLSRAVALASAGVQAFERLEIGSRAADAVETLTRSLREPPSAERGSGTAARPTASGDDP